MLKVLIRAASANSGYELTKYLDNKGCPWTIGESEDDILIGWSDFYDYLSEDNEFKRKFFYSPEIHFLESPGRVIGINELFPLRDPTTFDLLYKIGEDSVIYNRNMSVLKIKGKIVNLYDINSILDTNREEKAYVLVLYHRGLLSTQVEREIKESKFCT